LIGETYEERGAFDDAVSYFSECMEVLERDRGAEHPDLAKALQRLGDVTSAQKEFDKAFDYYDRALKIRRMDFDETLLAETLHSVGVLNRKRGDAESAEKLLLESLEINKRHSNTEAELGQNLFQLGHVYRMKSNYEKAKSMYEQSLALLEEDDELETSANFAVGHLKLSQGDYNGALEQYERVKSDRFDEYGRDELKTANAARSLGIAKFLIGDSDVARTHLNEFVRVCDLQDDGRDSSGYALSMLLLGDILDAEGNADQARAMWLASQEICKRREEIVKELPALINMLSHRLGDGEGFLSRKEALEANKPSKVKLHSEEELALRTVFFVDD
jgi:tetratricopeptide (TPR) repeat protein